MNKVIQTGRLTRDPELRYTPNNRPVAQFTIAVNRRYAKETDEVKADFFPVEVWGKLAENCKTYLLKGSKVGVSGILRNKKYTDRDGIIRYVTYIVADEVEFLENKHQETSTTDNLPTPPEEPAYYQGQGEQSSLYDSEYINSISDDDLPF